MRMLFFKHSLAVLAGLALLTACGPSYQVVRPDPASGLLPTAVEVRDSEILTFKRSAVVHDVRFVLLRTASGGSHTGDYKQFMHESVEALGFENVIDREGFVQLVLQSPLRDSVGNVTDPIALARISSEIGPFLIIDAIQVGQGNAFFETRLRVTDASRGETLLDIHRIRQNWASLDREVNYPILNVLKRWFDESTALEPAEREVAAEGRGI